MTGAFRSALQGLGLIVGLSAIAFTGQLIWAHWSGQDTRNDAVDAAVFEAFRSIERQCVSEQWPNETVRCRGALDKLLRCAEAEDGCPADEIYCILDKLGFNLPSYFRADSSLANQSPC